MHQATACSPRRQHCKPAPTCMAAVENQHTFLVLRESHLRDDTGICGEKFCSHAKQRQHSVKQFCRGGGIFARLSVPTS